MAEEKTEALRDLIFEQLMRDLENQRKITSVQSLMFTQLNEKLENQRKMVPTQKVIIQIRKSDPAQHHNQKVNANSYKKNGNVGFWGDEKKYKNKPLSVGAMSDKRNLKIEPNNPSAHYTFGYKSSSSGEGS